jgi:uncharacterized protein YhhL (DUF1145 family)
VSAGKIVLLVIYAILAVLAMTQGDTSVGVWALRLIVLLVIVHTIEVLVFFKACREAGGSLPAHILNVFLFGVLHVKDIKAAAANS